MFKGSSHPVTGLGQAGGRGCLSATCGVSVMQPPGHAGQQSGVVSVLLDSSGVLGLLLSSTSLDFGRVRVRNAQIPWIG